MTKITAVEMAKRAGIDPKRFRAALRREDLPWHEYPHKRWVVLAGTGQHEDMKRVLNTLTART